MILYLKTLRIQQTFCSNFSSSSKDAWINSIKSKYENTSPSLCRGWSRQWSWHWPDRICESAWSGSFYGASNPHSMSQLPSHTMSAQATSASRCMKSAILGTAAWYSSSFSVGSWAFGSIRIRVPVHEIRYFASEGRRTHIISADCRDTFYQKLDVVEDLMRHKNCRFIRPIKRLQYLMFPRQRAGNCRL